MKKHILLLEDEYSLSELIKYKLEKRGFEVKCLYLGADGLEYLKVNPNCLMLADYKLPDMDISDLLYNLEASNIKVSFLVMTGINNQSLGIEMMRRGALDFVEKGLGFVNNITHIVERAFEQMLMKQVLEKSLESIKRNELMLRSFFENAKDIFFTADKSGRLIEVSPSIYEVLGYYPHEIIGKTIHPFFYIKKDFRKIVEVLNETASVKSFETLLIHKNGHIIYVSFSCSLLNIENNNFLIIGIVQDIINNKKQEMEVIRKVLEAEENERRKIAEAIHDDIGPLVSAIKIYFEKLVHLKDNDEKRLEIFEKASELIEITIQKSRDISNSLMSNVLDLFGLKSAVNSFVEKISVAGNIDFEIDVDCDKLSKPMEIFFYRASVELINNSIKHSFAKNISLRIRKNERNLSLVYGDNGIGFDIKMLDNPEQILGNGILSLINKISMLSGVYNIYTKPGKGFVMKINFDTKLI